MDAPRPRSPDHIDSAADTLVAQSDAAPTLPHPPSRATAVAPTMHSNDSAPGAVDPVPAAFGPAEVRDRYEQRRLLGEGGMGEVRLCKDAWIGREVAMKVVHRSRGSRADLRARFLREVRVQGQLEHPSVVPVYDLGVTNEGETFFTMKRVKGLTLDAIVEGLRTGDEAITAAFSRRKLLGAMSSACLAVAFAHSRGVVHRDLKPANVMVGDYGEVYVLDWGVAKVVGTADEAAPDDALAPDDGDARTEAGALLGTPGYMSPEQARGDTAAVGAQSDVYALGAILFELLALEPLHSATTAAGLLAATLRGGGTRPSERNPGAEIPPELDAICERALALEPADRFAGARDIVDAIDAFLDGERDQEQRRRMAEKHVQAAQAALARATQGDTGADAHAHRTEATRELGRALALDPTNGGILATLMSVLLEGPTKLPPAAEAELGEVNRRDRARWARVSAVQFAAWFLASPLILWMGVRDWVLMSALEITVVAVCGYSFWMGRTGKAGPRYMVFAIPMAFLAVSLLSGLFGPFVLLPGAVAVTATMFLVSLRPNKRTRRMILILSMFSVGVPLALEPFGFWPSYAFVGGAITILPRITELPALPSALLLTGLSLCVPLVANLMVGRSVANLVAAERRAFAQAWRLRQLLPAGEADVRAKLHAEPPSDRCPRSLGEMLDE